MPHNPLAVLKAAAVAMLQEIERQEREGGAPAKAPAARKRGASRRVVPVTETDAAAARAATLDLARGGLVRRRNGA